MEISYGSITSDPGATAMDDKDGDLTANIISDWGTKVDVNKIGDFLVNYSVSDQKGNEAIAIRKVKVKLNSSNYLGEYNTIWGINGGSATGNFISTISPGDNINQFVIYPFRAGDVHLKVNIGGLFGDQLSFSQTDWGLTTTGTGIIENYGKTIKLNFTVTPSVGNYNYFQTLTKQ